jgi:hypothetical protein
MRDPLGCGPALTFITMGTRLLVRFENQGQCARTNSCWFRCLALIQPFNGIRRFGKAQCRFVTVLRGRAQPNMRLKLSAGGRRTCWNAQWRPSILSAAPAGRSLSAIR